jgi:hypothetical protein
MMVKARGVKIRVRESGFQLEVILNKSGRPFHWGFRPSEFPWTLLLASYYYLSAFLSASFSTNIMTTAGRDLISDAAFDVLDRISPANIDAFSREQLCQALGHYEVPYNDRSRTTKTLANTLLKHRRIHARRAEEEETRPDPDAPLVPHPEGDGTPPDANLATGSESCDKNCWRVQTIMNCCKLQRF